MDLDISFNTGYGFDQLKKFLIDPELNIEVIRKAFDFATAAHQNQKRESGEPYISHPLWIAKVAAQLGIGQEAIMTALLHDCVEDTNVTIEEIAKQFGDEVALLVEGLTEVKNKTKGVLLHQTNIEVFRKFLFSSVDDVRILILRLIDKMHNGLTIGALSPERQLKHANRVMGIYGPIAEYVGLHYFKKILEDTAFKIAYPQEALRIEKMIADRSQKEQETLDLVKEELEKTLKFNNVNNFEIQSRIKSLYSSYTRIRKKTKSGKMETEGLWDRVGIRVLVESVPDCYTVLGLLHSKYNHLSEEFNDYISNPKPNGYRSIQTTLIWEDGITAEVQIRTFEMHEFNEFGPASHIAYKMGKKHGGGIEWVRHLVDWQKNDGGVNNYRVKVLKDFVYVFTPKGDVIQMPQGSSVLDFAYRVHTSVGDRCVGAKVNQKMVKIGTIIENGDLIEILTTSKPKVTRDWLNLVKTSWAREHIRKMTHF